MRALGLLLCFAACDAGVKPAPPPPAPKPPGPKVIVTRTDFDLSYLPADSDLVFHFDVKALRAAKLWPAYASRTSKWLMRGLPKCDYDPLSDTTDVMMGVALESQHPVLVFHGIDRDKLMKCLRAAGAGVDPSVTIDGDFVTLSKSTGRSDMLQLVDAHTVVMQLDHPTKESFAQLVGSPLLADAAMVAELKRAPSGVAITMVSRPDSKALAKKWAIGGHVRRVSGTLSLTHRLDAQFVTVLGSAEEAAQLDKAMQGQLENAQVKQMFDRLKARAQGDTITMEVGMTEKQLANLVTMIDGMLGGVSLPD